MAPGIEIRSLSFSYFEGAPSALSDISLHAGPNTCMAILGPSGAGKTTLLQILSGIAGAQFTTAVATGSITIGDSSYSPFPDRVLFPDVGYFMQDASVQLSGIKESVEEELGFTLDNLGVNDEEKSRRVLSVTSTLDIDHLRKRRPDQLSGGELQRVALGSLLVAGPRLLLLDEPLNALDSLAQQRLAALVRSLKATTTVIITDSSIDFSLAVADLFIVMDRGRIKFSGTRGRFLDSLDSFSQILPVTQWNDLITASRTITIEPRILRILRPHASPL